MITENLIAQLQNLKTKFLLNMGWLNSALNSPAHSGTPLLGLAKFVLILFIYFYIMIQVLNAGKSVLWYNQ